MKICPYCETENDDNALTCIQCEYEFEVISETVNNTSESSSSDFAEKSVQSENECRKPPHKSNSKTGIIALVSVLLVCGVAGGVYYSKNKAKIKAKTAIVTAKNSNKKSNKDVQKKETPAQSETAEDENSDSTVPLTDESSIPERENDFSLIQGEYTFSSGVGAWATCMTLNADGTFSGGYHDSDYNVVYYCNFKGNFSNLEKINETSYSMQLENLVVDEETIKDDGCILYEKVDTPYGFEGGTEYMVYLPGTPASTFSEEEKSWLWDLSEILNYTAICNVQSEYVFCNY